MHQFKNYIFDLDGTLVDSAEDIKIALEEALQAAGVSRYPKLSKSHIGPPIREILYRLKLDVPDSTLDRAVKLFRHYYDNGPMLETHPYPGVVKTINDLADWGCSLFIATYKPAKPTRRVVNEKLPARFQEVVSIDSFAGRLLDKTTMVKELLERHGLDPDETCVVGDKFDDVRAAVNNHCTGIGAAYGCGTEEELQDAGAQYLIYQASELLV